MSPGQQVLSSGIRGGREGGHVLCANLLRWQHGGRTPVMAGGSVNRNFQNKDVQFDPEMSFLSRIAGCREPESQASMNSDHQEIISTTPAGKVEGGDGTEVRQATTQPQPFPPLLLYFCFRPSAPSAALRTWPRVGDSREAVGKTIKPQSVV